MPKLFPRIKLKSKLVFIAFSSHFVNKTWTIQIAIIARLTKFDSLKLAKRCATSKYFQIIGSSNDIESYFGLDNTSSFNVQIFFCHWGHLAIIHLWLSANLFQLGWNANYELYTLNPIPTIPIAHGIWDAHIPLSYDYTIVLSYSAIYNVVCTVGFTNVFQIYNFVIICELLAACSIILSKLHLISLSELLQWLPLNKSYLFITTTTSLSIIIVQNNIRLNFHTGILFGLFSIAWSTHLLHVAIPISRGTQ